MAETRRRAQTKLCVIVGNRTKV